MVLSSDTDRDSVTSDTHSPRSVETVRPFDLAPLKHNASQDTELSMDVLQGWADTPHPVLRDTRFREPMLELRLIRNGVPTEIVFGVLGSTVTVGRYSPVTGPVDIDLGVLQDHERYRVGLPHARIYLESGRWWVEPMTWSYPTSVDGEPASSSGVKLESGSFLSLGSALFQVHIRGPHSDETADFSSEASLVYKQGGGISRSQIVVKGESLIIGRYSPTTGPVDIDLSGLPDRERVYVARRHALLTRDGDTWYIAGFSPRAPVFINRGSPLRQRHRLTHGEEIALGNVIFQFAHTAGLLAAGPLASAVLGRTNETKKDDGDS